MSITISRIFAGLVLSLFGTDQVQCDGHLEGCRSIRRATMGKSLLITKPLEIGLREQHKLDKLRRIKAAATKLFSEKGFEGATTREIARRAHLSQATIFQYVEDKNELALLVFTDKIEHVHKSSFAAIRPEMSLWEQLMTAFGPSYQEFIENVKLTRALLKTAPEFRSGKQAKRVQELRREMIAKLAEIIEGARRRGIIGTDEDPGFIARDLFGSMHAAMRFWLAKENPDTSESLADLRRIIKLHIQALNPTAEAFGEAKSQEAVS
jgi:AcrR family transcriptional regulator